MAKVKTRMNELDDAGVDYSMPIEAFSKKAKTLFNRLAKEHNVSMRAADNEYSDGAARVYLDASPNYDEACVLGRLLVDYDKQVRTLADQYTRLATIKLPVTAVLFMGDEFSIDFCG